MQRHVCRDGPGLQHIQRAARVRPFHIDRFLVDVLDAVNGGSQFDDLRVRQTLLLGSIAAFFSEAVVDDSIHNRVHDDAVRRDVTADQCFTQAPTGIDQHFIEVVGERIQRERDAGDIARHHLLHHNRNRRIESLEAHRMFVQQHTAVEAGAEAAPYGRRQRVAVGTQHRFVEPRERGAGQVFFR